MGETGNIYSNTPPTTITSLPQQQYSSATIEERKPPISPNLSERPLIGADSPELFLSRTYFDQFAGKISQDTAARTSEEQRAVTEAVRKATKANEIIQQYQTDPFGTRTQQACLEDTAFLLRTQGAVKMVVVNCSIKPANTLTHEAGNEVLTEINRAISQTCEKAGITTTVYRSGPNFYFHVPSGTDQGFASDVQKAIQAAMQRSAPGIMERAYQACDPSKREAIVRDSMGTLDRGAFNITNDIHAALLTSLPGQDAATMMNALDTVIGRYLNKIPKIPYAEGTTPELVEPQEMSFKTEDLRKASEEMAAQRRDIRGATMNSEIFDAALGVVQGDFENAGIDAESARVLARNLLGSSMFCPDTGLPTGQFVNLFARRAFNPSKTYTWISCDLNAFGAINRVYGERVADQLMQEVAKLQVILNDQYGGRVKTIRIGGKGSEEIGFIIEDAREGEAEGLVKTVRDHLGKATPTIRPKSLPVDENGACPGRQALEEAGYDLSQEEIKVRVQDMKRPAPGSDGKIMVGGFTFTAAISETSRFESGEAFLKSIVETNDTADLAKTPDRKFVVVDNKGERVDVDAAAKPRQIIQKPVVVVPPAAGQAAQQNVGLIFSAAFGAVAGAESMNCNTPGGTCVNGVIDRNGNIVMWGNIQDIRRTAPGTDAKIRAGELFMFGIIESPDFTSNSSSYRIGNLDASAPEVVRDVLKQTVALANESPLRFFDSANKDRVESKSADAPSTAQKAGLSKMAGKAAGRIGISGAIFTTLATGIEGFADWAEGRPVNLQTMGETSANSAVGFADFSAKTLVAAPSLGNSLGGRFVFARGSMAGWDTNEKTLEGMGNIAAFESGMALGHKLSMLLPGAVGRSAVVREGFGVGLGLTAAKLAEKGFDVANMPALYDNTLVSAAQDYGSAVVSYDPAGWLASNIPAPQIFPGFSIGEQQYDLDRMGIDVISMGATALEFKAASTLTGKALAAAGSNIGTATVLAGAPLAGFEGWEIGSQQTGDFSKGIAGFAESTAMGAGTTATTAAAATITSGTAAAVLSAAAPAAALGAVVAAAAYDASLAVQISNQYREKIAGQSKSMDREESVNKAMGLKMLAKGWVSGVKSELISMEDISKMNPNASSIQIDQMYSMAQMGFSNPIGTSVPGKGAEEGWKSLGSDFIAMDSTFKSGLWQESYRGEQDFLDTNLPNWRYLVSRGSGQRGAFESRLNGIYNSDTVQEYMHYIDSSGMEPRNMVEEYDRNRALLDTAPPNEFWQKAGLSTEK